MLGLLLILVLFYLLTLGIPEPLTRRITAYAHEKGLSLQIDSIQLSLRGWVLRNVRIYSPRPDDLNPLFRAEKLYLFLKPDHWTALSKTGWIFSLHGKNLQISPGGPSETLLRPDHPFRTIHRLRASIHVQHNQLQLKDSEIRWGGLRLHMNGHIDGSESSSQQALPEFQIRVDQLANTLEKLQFEPEPEVNIRFSFVANDPDKNTLSVRWFAQHFFYNHQLYGQLRGTLDYNHRQWNLPSLRIEQPNGHHLTLSGSFDLANQIAQLNLQNTLCAEDLLNLLPPRIPKELARIELQPLGVVDFEVTLGPAPPGQLLEQIRASIRNVQVLRKDLTLDPLQFKLTRQKDRLEINEIQALANGGTLSGDFEINLSSLAWRTSLQSSAQPDPIGTLVGPGLQTWIDRIEWTNQPPEISVTLSYDGTKGSLKMNGDCFSKNLSCAGEPLDTLHIGMAYTNRVLTLAPLHATHQNRQFKGRVQVDFEQKRAQFNITTNEFSPTFLAHVLAPNHPSFLEKIEFNGPIQSTGNGQIDYGTWTNHTIHGILHAEQIETDRIKTDLFKSQLECQGTQLLFTNASLKLYEGSVEGSATFDLRQNDGTAPYHLNLHATKLNLAQLLQNIDVGSSDHAEGLLSGILKLSADAHADFWKSATGNGQIQIEQGRLGDLPLLGGFSRFIPGFKLFSITTFFADYELQNGKLHSENIQIGSTFLSAQAKGSYSPEDQLNIKLRAAPLRQTREQKKWYQLHLWSAEALKLTTAPFFDLLEFKLEGSLENPQWRLVALPKEIYEIIRPQF